MPIWYGSAAGEVTPCPSGTAAPQAGFRYRDTEGALAGFKMIGYQNHRDHAEALREAIAAGLLGKEDHEQPAIMALATIIHNSRCDGGCGLVPGRTGMPVTGCSGPDDEDMGQAREVLSAAPPLLKTILLPAENIALTVARGMVMRGENPGINTTTVLIAALDRLTGRGDWREGEGR